MSIISPKSNNFKKAVQGYKVPEVYGGKDICEKGIGFEPRVKKRS